MKISTEEKKAMIIQNFVSLLKQYGIEKVTLNDVAEKSGLTKSALYYYFDSKETLMIASFKKYRSTMLAKLDSILKKAKDPKEAIKLYCDFLFDLPQDKDFARVMTFSDTVITELAKYIVNVPEVTSEIVRSKKADFDQVTLMIAKYAGVSESDPRTKKIALFFSASCGETLRYLFKTGLGNLSSGTANQDFCRLESEYKEIMHSLTKDDFSAFVISGLDALIKTTFENKN
ncbi:TetR/AcrR family transcriptional regulator [bacterium]|nr:TetR/AcrR family transcriptional regulator [bacterium]